MTGTSCNSANDVVCQYYQGEDEQRRQQFYQYQAFLNALAKQLDPCRGDFTCAANNALLELTGITGCLEDHNLIDCAGFTPYGKLLKATELSKLDEMLRAANFGRKADRSRDVREISESIASGHAFTEHGRAGDLPLGVTTHAQYVDVVQSIIMNPQEVRQISAFKWIFYRENTVVVVNVNAEDFGTAFAASYEYFLRAQ